MEYRNFGSRFFIRLDKGEEVIDSLKKICRENYIRLGSISGIGAVNKATIGLFETSIKKYHSTELTGDHEITSLMGNISTMDGEVYLHVHANISDKEYKTYGGHLNAAVVSATCELIIDVADGHVGRKFNEEIGLNLYRFQD